MIFNLMKPIPTTESATMYSYNGTVLPALPDWDKEKYPYAVLHHQMASNIQLLISKAPWRGTGEDHVQFNINYGEAMANESAGMSCWLQYNDDYAYWGELKAVDSISLTLGKGIDSNGDGVYGDGFNVVMWSNHNIISADGTTILISASNPVPVYE